jgi:hypothetical protein
MNYKLLISIKGFVNRSPVRDISFVETKLSIDSKSCKDVTILLTRFCIVPMGLIDYA